ncbi:TlpA family protein disulfide reductase [Hymenobacter sp. BT664]|uniref:TlpA family protein disulfide reductase n=1 Tax=Hymenobacter montanus TaxID=2771359 RepID=A0A927GI96_9BACT|nr:TlpA family protein disulfide reductase [Hymenobacter montanus]
MDPLQRGILATGWWRAAAPQHPASLAPARAGRRAAYPHELALTTLDGRPARLSALAGKVVFVNLWASWCPPCVAELPGIHALYQRMNPAKVAFVLISLDENPAKARALLKRQNYTFPVYFPAAPLPAPFDSPSLPTTIILTPDGQVAAQHTGLAEYNTAEFKAGLETLAK